MRRQITSRARVHGPGKLVVRLGFAIVVSSGCDLLLDRDSLVVDSCPGEAYQVVRVDERLSVTFDRAMDQHSVETLFHLDSDRGVIGGISRWHDHEFRFSPHQPLSPGTRYRMRLHGHVRDARGREHRVAIDLPFFAGERNYLPPDVVSSDPASGSTIAPADPVILRFAAVMDETVTARHVHIQPEAKHTLAWQEGGRLLVITPVSRWSTPSSLAIRIAADAADHNGVTMARERRFSFFAQGATTRPTVTSVRAVPMIDGREPAADAVGEDVTAEDAVIPLWSAIRIQFSQPMDRASVERAWRVEPSVAGSFRWPDAKTVVFVPAAPFEPDLIYQLTLVSQAADIDGNRIAEAFNQAVSPTETGLRLVRLLISGSPDVITEFATASSVLLYPSVPPYYAMLLQLEFSHPFRSSAEKQTVMQTLSMTRLLPGGQSSPTAVQYGWITDRALSISYHGFSPPESNEQALYLLRIPGGTSGIRTSGGHRMTTDVEVLFCMEEP